MAYENKKQRKKSRLWDKDWEIRQIKIKTFEDEQRAIIYIRRCSTYLKNNKPEPWASRWIGSPVGYLCSKEQREEWFGDLNEVIHDMRFKRYPEWMINLICVGKTTVLVISALKIKISDFFTLEQKSE